MSKEYIEKMLDGIDDKIIAEALNKPESMNKSNEKSIRKIVAVASICICVIGMSASVLAATNPTFRKWITSFNMEDVKTEHGRGVMIIEETEQEDSSQAYYLTLNYLPKGYKCEGDDTFIYYGPNGDTDFINIAYFHLQNDFTNILPQADKIENYETAEGTAYIASSEAESRVWILFNKGAYMMELRDKNKMLSQEEIYKIIDGATIRTEKPSVVYETLEWTKKSQESYKGWLKTYEK